ncbi:MAG: Asp23/Gls24 family envelope stress response protein [Clostridiales Family XIII bacterium]|nr:Asp23/Gls24 family envelope stress response protein [Clostridiales Family XIII bacterium]
MGDSIDTKIISADEDQIAAIVCEAVLEENGIYALGADMSAAAITKNLLNRENRARGVHLVSDDDGWIIDIYVIVNYGTNIPETAWNVQRRVSERLKAASEIHTKEININVQGVHVPK